MTQPSPTSISIPGYRVKSKLGQGGMASVYLAIQESFDREVALKIMSPFLNSDPSFTTRFVREARIVAQIQHASIVPVIDVGEHQSNHYLSMEYLPGGDLKQRIQQGKHGLTLAVNTCTAIASALDVAHRKGFVHRDIKPENILFREDGTPVLTDFGIARAIDAGTSLTMAGMMVGTPNYMSPEQVKGQELDGRSDLYSLGIVFFETLTGTVPFRADSTMSLALKHISDPLPSLPAEFGIYQPFMDRLTAKDREDRFASGAEVTRALRLIMEMSNPRAQAQVRPTMVPGAEGTVGGDTLVTTRRANSLPANVEVPQPQASKTVQISKLTTEPPEPPTIVPAKAKPPKAPSKPVFAPLAKAVMAALRNAATSVATALRGLKLPARLAALRVSTGRWSMAATLATLRGWGRAFGSNKPATRYASWVAAGVAGLAVGFGGFLAARNTGPTPAQKIAMVPTQVTEPKVQEPVPEPAPEVEDVALKEEIVAMLQEVTTAQEALVNLDKLRRKVDIRVTERRRLETLAKEREKKQKEDEEARLADEASADRLLNSARIAAAEGRFYEPAGNNAGEFYRDVLNVKRAKAETKAEATAGQKKIADLVARETERNLRIGRVDPASMLVQRLRDIQSQHPQLAGLETLLRDVRSAPPKLSDRQLLSLRKCDDELQEGNERLSGSELTLRKLDYATDNFERADKCTDAPGVETLQERIFVKFEAATKAALESNNRKEAERIVKLAKDEKRWFTPAMEGWAKTLQATAPQR